MYTVIFVIIIIMSGERERGGGISVQHETAVHYHYIDHQYTVIRQNGTIQVKIYIVGHS